MHQVLIFIAGMLNALYLLPLSKDSNKNNPVWFIFALLGFCVIPLATLLIFIAKYGLLLTYGDLFIIALTGIVYGIGIVLLTVSIRFIGVGVPYILTLILGTFNGALFTSIVLGKLNDISTIAWLGYLTFLVAACCISVSLLIREKGQHKKQFFILVCVFASILASFQGACIGYFSQEMKVHHFPPMEQIVPWLIIFVFSSFIIMGYYGFKVNKTNIKKESLYRAFPMVLFYGFSVILYAYANEQSAFFSAKYNWVIFMASMMVGGNVVSYIRGEWKAAPNICNFFNMVAVIFVVVSCFLISP